MANRVVIGVTGSFGSGCTTVTEALEKYFGFKSYSLSLFLREEWSRQHNGESAENATRGELQDLGNRLRSEKGLQILAKKAYEKVDKEGNLDKDLVFDSIRNPAEIAFLRSMFPQFYVIAVDCAEADRWEREKVRQYYEKHKMTRREFLKDDERDKNEDGIVYGQQVALCVDEADYLIRNDNEPMVTTERAIMQKLSGKLEDPVKLFRGELRPPIEKEAYMSIAYAASLLSHCFKRQVGAVIIDAKGIVVSIGFNENSKPLKPCYEEFGDCYRDAYTEQVMRNFKACPLCSKELDSLEYPYVCPNCKKNIYHEVVRDRALGRCTALHAEEKAIMNAGSRSLDGCSLYVTTFPCFTCAQKILNADILSICYVESYPDVDSIRLFETAAKKGRKIIMDKFEGVKTRTYFKLFGGWRREKETKILEKKSK